MVSRERGSETYLQEAVNGGNRIEHDDQDEGVQTDAGQQERVLKGQQYRHLVQTC